MFQFLLCDFSLGSTERKGNQDLVLHPFWPHKDAWIEVSVHFQCRTEGSQVQQLHLLAAQSFPGDAAEEGMTLDVTHSSTSGAQAIAGVKLKQLWSSIMESEDTKIKLHCVCCGLMSVSIIFRMEALRMLQALNLTSVSRDAAAVLRWSGMSSWVWEWIPAGWSCHSGWRHSKQGTETMTQ